MLKLHLFRNIGSTTQVKMKFGRFQNTHVKIFTKWSEYIYSMETRIYLRKHCMEY